MFDFGQTRDGRQYLVTELLYGSCLAAAIAEQSFDEARTIAICSQLCDAVAAAHAHGVVHRDLKPENIFLTRRGDRPDTVKVLDFGLAKRVTGREGRSRLTRTGAVVGTPGFVAPEQVLGHAVGPAADLYAVGCIAYELLAGRPPFAGAFIPLLRAHATEAPPPLNLDPRWAALETLTMRLLAKRPQDRPESAAAAAAGFRECLRPPAKGLTQKLRRWLQRQD